MTADTKQVFYYGKGKGKRAFVKQNRNDAWHKVVNQHGFDVLILAEWQTEEEALLHEKFLIWCARDMGIELANISSGGPSASGSHHWLGRKHKPETIQKMKASRVGIKLKITSKFLNARQGKNNSGWQGYWITPDGTFNTCREVAKHYGIDTRTVRARCKGYTEQLVNSTKFYPPRDGWSFEPKAH
jgi:hypothetical protein